MTLFTTAHKFSLSWVTLIMFSSSQPISTIPSVPLSTNIRLDHTRGILPLGLPSKSHVCHIPRPFCYPHTIGEQYTVYSIQYASQQRVMQYPVTSCYLDCSAQFAHTLRVFEEGETCPVCRSALRCQATTSGTNYCHICLGWRWKENADVCKKYHTRPYEGAWGNVYVCEIPRILKVDTRDEWLALRSSRFIPVG